MYQPATMKPVADFAFLSAAFFPLFSSLPSLIFKGYAASHFKNISQCFLTRQVLPKCFATV